MMEFKKNNFKIMEDINSLKIIVQLEKVEIPFKLPKKNKSEKEIIKDLTKGIIELQKESKEIKNENKELQQKLDNEIKEKEKLKLKIDNIENQLKYILEAIKKNKKDINNESKINKISNIDRIRDDFNNYYETIEKIGGGGFDDVYKIKDKSTGELKALKRIYLDYFDDFDDDNSGKERVIKQIKKSIEIMQICSNKSKNINSVKFYEYFETKNEIAIIMELCDDNLSHILYKKEKGFTAEEIYKIMTQLNNTFKILKENHIIHRDITLNNILVKYEDIERKNFIVKLTDYGLSKLKENLTNQNISGLSIYMAPEILKGENYNYKCDLWSIGVILYQLLFKDNPYKGRTQRDCFDNNKKGLKPFFSDNRNLDDLIKGLLVSNPSKRMTWDEYFNHPFFKY